MPGALHGLRVIELTSHLSGPYCGMLLADQGADVIKVERPDTGDEARGMPPFVNGHSAPFMEWNRNKRSVTLDLKDPEDLAKCHKLIETADVLVENFKPGTAARLGLGFEQMKTINPRLVYCSISGFGQTGPYRARAGFDLITQAMSGLMAACGPKEGGPFRLPIALSDVNAGMNAAFGILCAIRARETSGEGQWVDVSLLESAIATEVYEAAGYFATGQRPVRMGQSHRGGSPYQVFETADGWICLGVTERLWGRLCGILGHPELEHDTRFARNADRVANNDELVNLLESILRSESSAHWLEPLYAAGIPAGPVMFHDETFTNEQVIAREMVVDPKHPEAPGVLALGTAIKLSGTPGGVTRPAPLLGQHNDEVLGC